MNLVTNGDFTTNGGNGQVGFNTTIAGWTVPTPTTSGGSYVFVYNAAGGISGTSADQGGSFGIASPPNVSLWGPDNGSVNGLTVSPDGGAFIASNPQYHNGPISQTINGLTPGLATTLTFDWAGAQQQGFTGPTTEGWQVSLGSVTVNTPLVSIPSEGFSGWKVASFTFTPTASSEVLTFLATGGPSETEPPFSLLDSVSLVPVPEPASWALLLVGVGVLGAGLRMRRQQVLAAG